MKSATSPVACCVLGAVLASFLLPARADVVITAKEQGGDVVFTFSGSIRTADSEFPSPQPADGPGGIDPSVAAIHFAQTPIDDSSGIYDGISSAPDSFGSGMRASASSRSGGIMGIDDRGFSINAGSGELISGTNTYAGETFSSLGIDPSGSPYVWTLANGETVTLEIKKAAPGILSHQGRIAVDGVNFDGAGQFKFAFVNAAGDTTYWSNDDTSTTGDEPVAGVPVPVTKGHYSTLLGDAPMVEIPRSVFSDNADVRLRIWFSADGGTTFEQLAPDRRIASVGYALNATAGPEGRPARPARRERKATPATRERRARSE